MLEEYRRASGHTREDSGCRAALVEKLSGFLCRVADWSPAAFTIAPDVRDTLEGLAESVAEELRNCSRRGGELIPLLAEASISDIDIAITMDAP